MRRVATAVLIGAVAMSAAAADNKPLVRGNTAFAIDFYKRQASQSPANVFFSPYSISAAMAMVDIGARGATATEIEKAMRFPAGGEKLATAWSSLQNEVKPLNPAYQLTTSNALWVMRGIKFKAPFIASAGVDFRAKIDTVDFSLPEAARARINSWVSEATRKMINDLIPEGELSPTTRLVITNAIYMKAKWLEPFDPKETNKNGRFHAPGAPVTASLMKQTDDFRFYRGEGLRILELPYENRELSMIIVLPDANDGLPAVETMLTPEKLSEWEGKLASTRVAVTLPRFSMELPLNLVANLKAMGIALAFNPAGGADFSGMTDAEKLFISNALHKARVDVTEEHTEAAAATAVIIGVTSAAPLPPKQPELFVADHPFVFWIRHNSSKSILFIGRLVKP